MKSTVLDIAANTVPAISRERLRSRGGVSHVRRRLCAIGLALLVVTVTAASASEVDGNLAPPEVDLRSEFERLAIAVRQQGNRGACQVMAMVGVMEFDLAKRGKKVDLSEQFIMWAANAATGRKRVQLN